MMDPEADRQGAMAGHSYKAAVDELDAMVARDLVCDQLTYEYAADKQDGPFRATVLEPVGKLNQYFNNVNAAIDKRNHKMLDYDSTRSKVRKMVEKPSDDTGKLPRVRSARWHEANL